VPSAETSFRNEFVEYRSDPTVSTSPVYSDHNIHWKRTAKSTRL